MNIKLKYIRLCKTLGKTYPAINQTYSQDSQLEKLLQQNALLLDPFIKNLLISNNILLKLILVQQIALIQNIIELKLTITSNFQQQFLIVQFQNLQLMIINLFIHLILLRNQKKKEN